MGEPVKKLITVNKMTLSGDVAVLLTRPGKAPHVRLPKIFFT
jgi:hypothetical protein